MISFIVSLESSQVYLFEIFQFSQNITRIWVYLFKIQTIFWNVEVAQLFISMCRIYFGSNITILPKYLITGHQSPRRWPNSCEFWIFCKNRLFFIFQTNYCRTISWAFVSDFRMCHNAVLKRNCRFSSFLMPDERQKMRTRMKKCGCNKESLRGLQRCKPRPF